MAGVSSLSVFFDGAMWVAVYEVSHEDGTVQAARHVFGAEPSNAEWPEWVRERGLELIERAHAAPRIERGHRDRPRSATNPKRLARLAAREQARLSRSTASQEAVKEALSATRAQARNEGRRASAERTRARRRTRVEKKRARRRGR